MALIRSMAARSSSVRRTRRAAWGPTRTWTFSRATSTRLEDLRHGEAVEQTHDGATAADVVEVARELRPELDRGVGEPGAVIQLVGDLLNGGSDKRELAFGGLGCRGDPRRRTHG